MRKRDYMKRIISLILLLSLIFCFYACCSNENDTTIPITQTSDYIMYGENDQFIMIHNNIDFGTLKEPHKMGESVRLRHSRIITSGNNDLNKDVIYDYNVTLTQVLIGPDAKNNLEENCANFYEEKFLFEDNDVYLVEINFKYNVGSDITEYIPSNIFLSAVNSQGEYIAVEHRLSDITYKYKTENGEVSNWYPIFVPKGEKIKLTFVIGSQMEYPGPVAAVYFDI